MNIFYEEYEKKYSEQEKSQYLISMLNFVINELTARQKENQNDVERLKAELQYTKEELNKANNTIERARGLYRQAKEDVEMAGRRAKKENYKDLQIVRDRVCAIIEIATTAGKRMEKDGRSKLSIEELNNILNASNSIIEEMINLELWTESDEKPEIREFKAKGIKKTSNKSELQKKESDCRLDDQIAIELE